MLKSTHEYLLHCIQQSDYGNFQSNWKQLSKADQQKSAPAYLNKASQQTTTAQHNIALLLLNSCPNLLGTICQSGKHELLKLYMEKSNPITMKTFASQVFAGWCEHPGDANLLETMKLILSKQKQGPWKSVQTQQQICLVLSSEHQENFTLLLDQLNACQDWPYQVTANDAGFIVIPRVNAITSDSLLPPAKKIAKLTHAISDEDISDEDSLDENISDEDSPDAHISDAHISDAHISDENISDEDSPDAHISDAHISDEDSPDENISDEDISDAHISDEDISDEHISDEDSPSTPDSTQRPFTTKATTQTILSSIDDTSDQVRTLEPVSVKTALEWLRERNFVALEAAFSQQGFVGTDLVLQRKQLVEVLLERHRLGRWTFMARTSIKKQYGDQNQILSTDYQRDTRIETYAKTLLQNLDPEFYQAYSAFDEAAWKALAAWYQAEIIHDGKLNTYDPSSDSDSDQEVAFSNAQRQSVSVSLLPEKRKRDEKEPKPVSTFVIERLRKMKHAARSSTFWTHTRRNSLHEPKTKKTTPKTKKITSKNLETRLKEKLATRADLPQQPKIQKPPEPYVAAYRGIHYLSDRWGSQEKRSHYQRCDINKTYFCEAALMSSGSNFYQQTNSASKLESANTEAERLQDLFENVFQKTGPCLADTVRPCEKPYFFNNFADFLQHSYSNGINEHLEAIAVALKERNHWLQEKFKTYFNYAISMGERPNHSLRYAWGLKEYYHDSLEPLYDKKGGLERMHAGKLHIFLFKASELIDQPNVHRVTLSTYEGKLPVDHYVAPEVELTFIGKVDGAHAVYELPLRFPSFNKNYKTVYEVKYGLDQDTYELFRSKICETQLFSEERKDVVRLLKEWLCAYYEVLAVSIAQDITRDQKKGQLIYLDQHSAPASTCILRPYTPGKEHRETRNVTHLLEGARWGLGKKVAGSATKTGCVRLFGNTLNLRREMEKAQRTDPNFIKDLAYYRTMELTEAEEAERIAQELPEETARIKKAKTILQQQLDTFQTGRGASTETVSFKFGRQ